MNGLTIYEFDALAPAGSGLAGGAGVYPIPERVFSWLEGECRRSSENGSGEWIRVRHRRGAQVLQVTSYVGVIRAPDGYQIEVLPKVGKAHAGTAEDARELLIRMLACLPNLRHVVTDHAQLLARRMPLLEVFISEFLYTVERIVKRGLRSDYATERGNLSALRGKLLVASQVRQNLVRADRFFTEHDEFSIDRAEHRLIHAALRRVRAWARAAATQKLARELEFVFTEVPPSIQPEGDFQRVRIGRDMGRYLPALAWARLILTDRSPRTGIGDATAPSLLFPMELVFEAFVAKHLGRQVAEPLTLKMQPRSWHLVRHLGKPWFQLKPDLLVKRGPKNVVVLDTKWKLLDGGNGSTDQKYGLSQADFYQLLAYGQTYLGGSGDLVLIFPRTASFTNPLPVFEYQAAASLRLWVMPFCLDTARLLLPDGSPFSGSFESAVA